MLEGLDLRTMTGIEFGALTAPLVHRSEGDIIYVDHADTETLRRKYFSDANVDVSRLVEVDAVWGANTLQQAIGEGRKVDYVIASHVVEHVPDLLGWLSEIEAVLRPTGSLRLAVPDRRFTFDRLRRESRLSDILTARLFAARAPLPAQILDHVLEVVAIDAKAVWRGEIGSAAALRRIHSLSDAIALAEDALRHGTYHDVHCWVFTPVSFARLLGRAAGLRLHGFACAYFHDTEPGELEFQVALQPCADAEESAESWNRMAREVRRGVAEPVDAAARHRLAETEAETEALRRRAYAAERDIAELRASTSWRMTSPLRGLVHTLRRH
jgi:SAM-dependent methyltransferase